MDAKGVNPCHYRHIQGLCQDDGKCKYPNEECRTNLDCGPGKFCTWHDVYVSGSCDPGYYSPSDCPLGKCEEYQTTCYTSTECGPGKFCTGEGCQDDCPPGECLPCNPNDQRVIYSG